MPSEVGPCSSIGKNLKARIGQMPGRAFLFWNDLSLLILEEVL